MAQNLFRKMKLDWTHLGNMTKDAFDNYAKHKIKPDLEQIDDGFQIKFRFQESERINNVTGALEYTIEIPPGSTFTRETDKAEVYVASLFTWLDKGIKVSHVRFFTDRKTGEKEAIASKKHFNYYDPYPPNNWTVDIAAKHQPQLAKVVRGVIRSFLGGKR